MPIGFDLTAEQGVRRNGTGTVLGFAELTSAARRPRELLRILWGERHDELVLHEDDIPKSAKQAAAVLLASLVRAENKQVLAGGFRRRLSAPRMFAHGAAELGRAAPRELRESIVLRRRAVRDCEVERMLPRHTTTPPRRILYSEPKKTSEYSRYGNARKPG